MQNTNLMQYAESFHQLINQFLALSKKMNKDKKVQKTSRQLTAFIKEIYFLPIAFHILTHEVQRDKLTLITSFVKDKFKYEFETIEPSQVKNYYDSLIEVARLIQCAIYPVFQNISLSLAYIYLNLCAQSSQNDQLNDIMQYLAPLIPKVQGQYAQYNYYFKVLQNIASEIENSRLVVDENSRNNARTKIIQQQYRVLIHLNQLAGSLWTSNKVCKQTMLECFTCWVEIQYNADIFNSLPQHFLMDRMFECLHQSQQSESAIQCLKILINSIKDPNQNAPIFQYLGSNIVSMTNLIQRLLNKKCYEDAQQFLTIIISFSEKAATIFVTDKSQSSYEFLNKLVGFTRQINMENYQELVNFWELILDQAQKYIKKSQLPQNLQELAVNLYESLIYMCRYSMETIQRLQTCYQQAFAENHQLGNQVYQRRQQSYDVFDKISKLLGRDKYLRCVTNKFKQMNPREDSFWSNLEVLLFSLIYPLKKLDNINSDVVLLISSFSELNDDATLVTPVAVKRGFLRIFRSLMGVKQKQEGFIQKLFFLTSTCFGTPLLMDQAERTFCKGCQQNGDILLGNMNQIVHLAEFYPHRQYLIRGLVSLACIKGVTIDQYLLIILKYVFQAIKSSDSKIKKRDCVYSLTAACKVLMENETIQNHMYIVRSFTFEIWSFIKETLMNPKFLDEDEDPEIQRLVKMLKYLMRCMKYEFSEFIQDLFNCVITAFEKYPICSYVYLVQVAITVFSKQIYENYLLTLYINFCEKTYNHLQNDNLQRYSYLLDDFIGMNKRFIIYNISLVFKSNQLPYLLDACCSFIGCDNPRVAKATYTFFETTFIVYWRQQFIDQYNNQTDNDKIRRSDEDIQCLLQLKKDLLEMLPTILTKMIGHLSQNPVEQVRNRILDAIFAELKALPLQNVVIWKNIIDLLPSDIMLSNERQLFMQLIVQTTSKVFKQCDQATNKLIKLVITMRQRLSVSAKRKSFMCD